MADREDARLVAALRAQDPAVARPLFKRFAPTISRLLRRTLGPQAPIDVAVDVVLLCVFHRARRLQPRSDLRQFVVGATARVARAELRPPALRLVSPRAAPEAAAPSTRPSCVSTESSIG
jgi:DNA-directed RNA polymerase specialized sigma24 family protein